MKKGIRALAAQIGVMIFTLLFLVSEAAAKEEPLEGFGLSDQYDFDEIDG